MAGECESDGAVTVSSREQIDARAMHHVRSNQRVYGLRLPLCAHSRSRAGSLCMIVSVRAVVSPSLSLPLSASSLCCSRRCRSVLVLLVPSASVLSVVLLCCVLGFSVVQSRASRCARLVACTVLRTTVTVQGLQRARRQHRATTPRRMHDTLPAQDGQRTLNGRAKEDRSERRERSTLTAAKMAHRTGGVEKTTRSMAGDSPSLMDR